MSGLNSARRNRALITAISLGLSACGSGGVAPVPARPANIPISPSQPSYSLSGLEAVMGRDAHQLVQMFGTPRLDVVEMSGRKLQFVGTPCILDAYLYPSQGGGREVVAHVDARNATGAAVDRAACVAALRRR